ncbi:hypothetical protein NE237_008979 [Protea cynaroides]|uniref:Uncharacterized protein n=1 Tax=Protea cynaroides TaxID=273540 RepID=A0A9Q0KX21_9MAGN|nr:hypothetical protein NE237_008979 [Protea cynaroides]
MCKVLSMFRLFPSGAFYLPPLPLFLCFFLLQSLRIAAPYIHEIMENEIGENIVGTGTQRFIYIGSPSQEALSSTGLSHGDVVGYLLDELQLLIDIASFRIYSNRFRRTVLTSLITSSFGTSWVSVTIDSLLAASSMRIYS